MLYITTPTYVMGTIWGSSILLLCGVWTHISRIQTVTFVFLTCFTTAVVQEDGLPSDVCKRHYDSSSYAITIN